MKVVTELSLALCCGFLGMTVSAWNAKGDGNADPNPRISGFLPAEQWERAVDLSRAQGHRILIYTAMAAGDPELRDGLAKDPVIQALLKSFVPVATFLDGNAGDRALAGRLGATAAPEFFVVEASAALARDLGEPDIVDRLRPLTGSAFERFGLGAELDRVRHGREKSVDPDSPSAGINGLHERYAQLQSIVQGFTVPYPGDVETPLDLHLATEGNALLRYYGWSWIASWLERCARQAAASGDGHLGVPRARWEARLRETSRRAWISCPDDRLLPFGSLLIQRYARGAADLDSLDRAFMAAVLRTLSDTPGALEFPGREWLAEARAAIPPK